MERGQRAERGGRQQWTRHHSLHERTDRRRTGSIDGRRGLPFEEALVREPDADERHDDGVEHVVRLAGEKDVDLVEIVAQADPPVCRLMDYGKFKYQEQKRAAEAKAKQKVIEVKEVKFRPGTDEGDYAIKMRNLRRFIEDVKAEGLVGRIIEKHGVRGVTVAPKA